MTTTGIRQSSRHSLRPTPEDAAPLLPTRMHGTPGALRRAPLLGEHTSEVLRSELGYTPEEVVILRQRNIV